MSSFHIIISDHYLCTTEVVKVQVTDLTSQDNPGELYWCAGNAANFPLVSGRNYACSQSSWRKAKVTLSACVGPSASTQTEQGDSNLTEFLEISHFWILTEMCRHFRFCFKLTTRMDTSLEDIHTFLIISLSDFSVFAIGYELRPKKKTT
jgi:hypothetical protein